MSDKQFQFGIAFDDPTSGIQHGLSLSGVEYIQAMQAGEIIIPIALLMNMRVDAIEVGRVVFASEPGIQYCNPLGTVHGGYHATLLDSAMGCAIHSTLAVGVGYTTLQLNIHYLRPITLQTKQVFCEGRVVHSGRRVATAEGKLTDADGKIFAHGTTTCAIFSTEG
jgi:uncharacterized protein (TIGR00369 family)